MFLDSTYLLDNTLEMFYENMKAFLLRLSSNTTTASGVNMMFQATNVYEIIKIALENVTVSEYAMLVNLQIEDRLRKYSQDDGAEILEATI